MSQSAPSPDDAGKQWNLKDHDLLIRLDSKMDQLLEGLRTQQDNGDRIHEELRGKVRDLELRVVRLSVIAAIGGTVGGAVISALALIAVKAIWGVSP